MSTPFNSHHHIISFDPLKFSSNRLIHVDIVVVVVSKERSEDSHRDNQHKEMQSHFTEKSINTLKYSYIYTNMY